MIRAPAGRRKGPECKHRPTDVKSVVAWGRNGFVLEGDHRATDVKSVVAVGANGCGPEQNHRSTDVKSVVAVGANGSGPEQNRRTTDVKSAGAANRAWLPMWAFPARTPRGGNGISNGAPTAAAFPTWPRGSRL